MIAIVSWKNLPISRNAWQTAEQFDRWREREWNIDKSPNYLSIWHFLSLASGLQVKVKYDNNNVIYWIISLSSRLFCSCFILHMIDISSWYDWYVWICVVVTTTLHECKLTGKASLLQSNYLCQTNSSKVKVQVLLYESCNFS